MKNQPFFAVVVVAFRNHILLRNGQNQLVNCIFIKKKKNRMWYLAYDRQGCLHCNDKLSETKWEMKQTLRG